MKKIVLLLLLVVPLVLIGQRKVIFDTTIVNTTSEDFFKKNVVIDSIAFDADFLHPRYLSVYPKTIWYDSAYKKMARYNSEYYKYDFLGDRYLFVKKYGRWQMPVKEMAMAISKSCGPHPSIRFVAKMDSIKFLVESYCPVPKAEEGKKVNGEGDEEKIFIKLEVGPDYKNGISDLQHQIETAFKKKRFEARKYIIDSALIFDIRIAKDSCVKNIELIEGRYSEFVQFIMDELKMRCSWKPGLKDGRQTIWPLKIFFQLNKDKSITLGIDSPQVLAVMNKLIVNVKE